MIFSSVAIVVVAIIAGLNGQNFEVFETDRICTNWLLVQGSSISLNLNTAMCQGPTNYELKAVSQFYFVKFCCPFIKTPEVEVGPVPGSCGKQAVSPIRTRIVGGQEARPHSWPWLVSMQYQNNHFCGGTLIDEYHVLTAAHCLDDPFMHHSQISIVAGLHRRSQLNYERIQRKGISAVYKHELYNEITSENDIAIIRLSSPVKITSYVNVACLPGREAQMNENVMIAGWGTLSYEGSSPDVLQQANITIMGNCKYVYQFDERKQICAGSYDYRKDSCQGDSGGPLVNEVNGQWFLSGVVSYGDECAKPGSPGVYARVSYYLPWILSKMNRT